jgi:hypothetical protein
VLLLLPVAAGRPKLPVLAGWRNWLAGGIGSAAPKQNLGEALDSAYLVILF